jgi:hypothetical protein
LKCHYHPRTNATLECSACGVGLCKRCAIEDHGNVYCDSCYAAGESDEETKHLEHAEEADHEDYIDLELMDMLDTEDDEGLF